MTSPGGAREKGAPGPLGRELGTKREAGGSTGPKHSPRPLSWRRFQLLSVLRSLLSLQVPEMQVMLDVATVCPTPWHLPAPCPHALPLYKC